MSVLGGGDTNFVVLKNHAAVLDLMGVERAKELPVGTLGVCRRRLRGKNAERNRDVLECGVDELLSPGWAVDRDGLCGIAAPQLEKVILHHIGEAESVVWMQVCEKDCRDLVGVNAGLQHAAHGADAAVDEIFAAVDDQQRGGFGAVRAQGRSAGSAEEKEFRAVRRPGRGANRACRRSSQSERYDQT